MHILTTSTERQTLKIIPRFDSGLSIAESYEARVLKNGGTVESLICVVDVFENIVFELIDKSTGAVTEVPVDRQSYEPFMELSGEFSLTEDRLYSLRVKDGSMVIYKGLVFCTNQTDYNKFDVHKDDYVVENSYNNEYVIL